MFTHKEKEFLEAPDRFIERYGRNYKYILMNKIRIKFCRSIEDLFLLIKYLENDSPEPFPEKKPVGRPSKRMVFYFGFNAIRERLIAYESTGPKSGQFIKSSQGELRQMFLQLFIGTKYEKFLIERKGL